MRKALVIGLEKYHGCELSCCNNDACSIAQLLETNGDGSPNFDVKLITDSCRKSNLQTSIKELFADEADITLLYFSGHGANEDGGYLVSTDCCVSDYGIRMSDVLAWANSSKSRNKIIILDCCFSGQMGKSLLTTDCSLLGEGITIMASSRAWQTSAEKSILNHGVFTELLLQGLEGGAADIGGNITPASLYSFVDQSLGAWEQRPVFKTNISRFLPIRTIDAKVPKDVLRRISKYFQSPGDEFKLDPSYEFTNDPKEKHDYVKPYADSENVAVFKELQMLESVGLIEPVDEKHMYFAAMHSKGCKLTPLGLHYWRLSKDRRF